MVKINKGYIMGNTVRNKIEAEINKTMRRRSDEMMSEKDKETRSKAKEEAARDANSRAQYKHERDAGDPNALMLSYDEWKKL